MSGVHHPPAELQWRLLQPPDLDAMEALHRLSITGMAAKTVKPESRAFLESLLQGRGRVTGALASAQLVAYGVLQHDLLAEDDPRHHLGLPAHQPVAKLAGAAVDPGWRGLGLQRALIAQRVTHAGPDAVLFATAAPDNTPSWHNLLACGFAVRALEYRYGGFARYLLVRDAAMPTPTPTSTSTPYTTDAGLELDGSALPRQQSLLAQGWRGIAPGQAAGSLRLVPPPQGTA